jgi:hypothetical protein
MSEPGNGLGGGILRGLKKILFTGDTADSGQEEKVIQSGNAGLPSPALNKSPVLPAGSAGHAGEEAVREMKLKVYQLLESLNKPGIDFFEVWNAAVEMGGPVPENIKAAFTSLRYADPTLTKSKLIESATAYMDGLRSILDTETSKRLDEKSRLTEEKESNRTRLEKEIAAVTEQIRLLNEKLRESKAELNNNNDKYESLIAEIDRKIEAGKKSVQEVLSDMAQVQKTIQTTLN